MKNILVLKLGKHETYYRENGAGGWGWVRNKDWATPLELGSRTDAAVAATSAAVKTVEVREVADGV